MIDVKRWIGEKVKIDKKELLEIKKGIGSMFGVLTALIILGGTRYGFVVIGQDWANGNWVGLIIDVAFLIFGFFGGAKQVELIEMGLKNTPSPAEVEAVKLKDEVEEKMKEVDNDDLNI